MVDGVVDWGNHSWAVVEHLAHQDRYREYKNCCNLERGEGHSLKAPRASLAYQFRDHGAGCELKLNCEEWRGVGRYIGAGLYARTRPSGLGRASHSKPRGGKAATPSGA